MSFLAGIIFGWMIFICLAGYVFWEHIVELSRFLGKSHVIRNHYSFNQLRPFWRGVIHILCFITRGEMKDWLGFLVVLFIASLGVGLAVGVTALVWRLVTEAL